MVTSEGLIGIRERVITKEETSYGEAISLASAVVPGYNVVVNPTFTQGFQEVTNNGADVRTINKRVAGPLSLAYTLAYSPSNWQMLKYVFDIDSETGSDPYTHTLSVGNTLKSFTSEWAMRHSTDPMIFKTVGNVINQFRISFAKATGEGNTGFIGCTANVIAKDYTTPSIQAGSFTATGDPFQYRHSKMTLSSSEVVEINNGEISFTQGMNPNDSRYANSTLGRTIGTPIVTLFRITGRINVNLLSTTLPSLWETAAVISGTNTLVFEQSASNKITFTFSGVYCEPVPIAGTNLEGINTGDFVFTATGVSTVVVDSIENY
ncbi:MAG: hypothetical protein ACTSO3_11730 [Candidatus Heimdallarchaeaceae archaeon]